MTLKLRFPLRFKILIAQLLLVSVTLSLITFTMARLFHNDKTAYIHDLTSTVVLHTAEEANALLGDYKERLRIFARLMSAAPASGNSGALEAMFEEFGDFVMVTWDGAGRHEIVFDEEGLGQIGITKDALVAYRAQHPLPNLKPGELYLENAAVAPNRPTLAVTLAEKDGAATAFVGMDQIQRLARRSRVFETFLLDSAGRYVAHSDRRRIGAKADASWWERVRGVAVLGSTIEYQVQGKGMVGGFAKVPVGGLVAGVQLPKSAAYLTSRELLSDLLLVSVYLLGGGTILSLFWSRRLTRPIEELSRATRMVGQGQFEIQVQAGTADEIGDLGTSFNRMAGELKNREAALKELYEQLVQSEKMAAFGALGAGIAHEVKNPLAGILGLAQLSQRAVEKGTQLEKNLLTIEKETKRCRTIIENLLRFARQEKVEFAELEIGQVVEDALAIVDHQLGINGIRVEKELDRELPPLKGNANQLQQVLMNLMINAQQAMEGSSGTVRLSAKKLEGAVEVRVCDNGPGIDEAVQSRIFEPFFTTKPAGKGTGLGLSVTYGIVKDHGGEIRLESRKGEGATFIITLPVAGETTIAAG
ncbi:ATP-binding protein [Geomesophilobacter sediminis]|uniref:histidine kinase n=1 Tax=Geomesophilobacter sediminis TaxID=2798584 RepID=A0A8J7JD22_9BACT|nr:ATP-binding protein [Geomesophilobacter sediminis]MBJ6723279.1 HAMP domain-containing protein [Geomesophilobacter sediminis]